MENLAAVVDHTQQIEEVRQHFLYNENYDLLKKLQQEIFQQVEVSPSIRKLVNDLITPESLQSLKAQYLSIWK